jgi:hypothetical protein
MRASIWMEASHYLIRAIGMRIKAGLFTPLFRKLTHYPAVVFRPT